MLSHHYLSPVVSVSFASFRTLCWRSALSVALLLLFSSLICSDDLHLSSMYASYLSCIYYTYLYVCFLYRCMNTFDVQHATPLPPWSSNSQFPLLHRNLIGTPNPTHSKVQLISPPSVFSFLGLSPPLSVAQHQAPWDILSLTSPFLSYSASVLVSKSHQLCL